VCCCFLLLLSKNGPFGGSQSGSTLVSVPADYLTIMHANIRLHNTHKPWLMLCMERH
jgi:hypothetical protein